MGANKPVTKDRGCLELTPLEKETLRAIFEVILESGKAPIMEELQVSLKKSDNLVIRVLDKLEAKDILLRRKGTQEIVSIYPFSLVPTEHQVVLDDGKKLFAMCAVDALGMPNMFDKNAKIVSQCEWCKEKMTIEVTNGKIVSKSHSDILIWNAEEIEMPAAETCCPLVNFFCSKEHFREWKDKNPDLLKNGHSNKLEQEYRSIKERWKHYGETIGVV